MKDWTPEQWGILLGSVALFITTAITPLVQLWLAKKTDAKVERSTQVSLQNKDKLETVAVKADEAAEKAKEAVTEAKTTKEEVIAAVKNGQSNQ